MGREGPGPERPGPDYPPEWDREPAEPSCRSPYGCLAPGEGCPGRCPVTEEEAREMEHAPVVAPVTPDPWTDPDAAARLGPPPF